MGFDRFDREIQQIRYIFCAMTMLYKIGYFDLCGSQFQVFGGEGPRKGRNNIIQIGFQDIDISLLPCITTGLSQLKSFLLRLFQEQNEPLR